MENIAVRIKELIQEKGLTNKEFAEKLNINPSIVSHILSGRNKVSLQVVEGIKKSFTNVNLDYLLLGTGSLFKEFTNVNIDANKQKPTETPKETKDYSQEQDLPENEGTQKPQELKTEAPVPYSSAPKTTSRKQEQSAEIERIVVFYKDGSFRNYVSNE